MKKYIEVFPQFSEITGFFSGKELAVEGSPYDNPGFIERIGLGDADIVWPGQIHGDTIAVIDRGIYDDEAASGEDDRAIGRKIRVPDTDGAVTNLEGVLLTTVHADCLPVYFYDPVKGAIGLVHSGWRGTNLGIAPKCVRVMTEEYGSNPADVHSFIGPGICKDCFETGPEVRDEFMKHWPFIDDFAVPKGEKFYIDLKGIVKRQLLDAGLDEESIEVTDHCTYHEPELFCSYRREGGTYMRMGAGLCIKKDLK